MSNARAQQARRLIQHYSQQSREGWLGIAPSYLCDAMGIGYEDAAFILKDLEEAGFIYDNGHGNHFRLPDGRIYATRYYMTPR